MLKATLLIAAAAVLPAVLAQGDDGSLSGPTSSSSAAGYSCDTSKCKLPSCNCASTSPPGGLSPVSLLYPYALKWLLALFESQYSFFLDIRYILDTSVQWTGGGWLDL